jgi:outer membrane protein OmpA-like peptidoglycan-associated protein
MAAGGIRQVTATEIVNMTPMIDGFPSNFTLEMETKYANYVETTWRFFPKGSTDNEALEVAMETRGDSGLRVMVDTQEEGNVTDATFPIDLGQPVRSAIWVQNGRLRIYLNGRRVVDLNQLKLPEFTRALLIENPSGGASAGLRSVRIAESTPDFSRSILATGRYVTYGIQFDTDSDHVKPESAGVIKSIATGLQSNPDLKLRIEGHTDASGNDAHNLDLSKRRAEAVRTILVSQFQVDAGRLSAAGMGSSKPVAANDTPQGRAQNRRVEFVKQ